MSQLISLTLESARHGSIQGSMDQGGFEDLIEVFSTSHEVSLDLNAKVRRSRSRNLHRPFVVTKGIDKATVRLYDSWNNSDRITKFQLDCYKSSQAGNLELFYTVELEDASISSIHQQLANPSLSPVPEQEVVSFVYRSISWRFADGSIEANSATNSKF